MNEISRDIEREQLLNDCMKLRHYNIRGDCVDMNRIVYLCLEEDMEAEEVQAMVFDNALVVANIESAINTLYVEGEHFIADMIDRTLKIKLSELPVKYIR